MKYITFTLLVLFTLLPTKTSPINNVSNIVGTLSIAPPPPLSSTLLDIVRESESFSSNVYICPSGHKTIGFGFKLSSKDTLTHITESEANIILSKKLLDIKEKVQCSYNVSQYQAEALTSLIYNVGWDTFKKSNFSKTLKNGGSKSIREINFKSFRKAGGEVLRGLEIRRGKEWELWNKR